MAYTLWVRLGASIRPWPERFRTHRDARLAGEALVERGEAADFVVLPAGVRHARRHAAANLAWRPRPITNGDLGAVLRQALETGRASRYSG